MVSHGFAETPDPRSKACSASENAASSEIVFLKWFGRGGMPWSKVDWYRTLLNVRVSFLFDRSQRFDALGTGVRVQQTQVIRELRLIVVQNAPETVLW